MLTMQVESRLLNSGPRINTTAWRLFDHSPYENHQVLLQSDFYRCQTISTEGIIGVAWQCKVQALGSQ